MPDVKLPELESEKGYGNEGLNKVNDFLISKGMTDRLLPGPIAEDDIAVAVYLLILSKWINPGQKTYRRVNGQELVCAENNGIVKIDLVSGKPFGILYLENGDYVIFEDISSVDDSELEFEANGVRLATIEPEIMPEYDYSGVVFAHVELDINRDIDEITGLTALNTNDKLSLVKGQCKLKLNHLGAKLEIAMSAIMESTSIRAPKYLEFLDTFTVHFVRKNEMSADVYASIQVTSEDFHEVEIDFGSGETEPVVIDLFDDQYLVNPNLERNIA